MAPRVTYRRVCSYNTKANRVRRVKTPGNIYLYTKNLTIKKKKHDFKRMNN